MAGAIRAKTVAADVGGAGAKFPSQPIDVASSPDRRLGQDAAEAVLADNAGGAYQIVGIMDLHRLLQPAKAGGDRPQASACALRRSLPCDMGLCADVRGGGRLLRVRAVRGRGAYHTKSSGGKGQPICDLKMTSLPDKGGDLMGLLARCHL